MKKLGTPKPVQIPCPACKGNPDLKCGICYGSGKHYRWDRV